MKTLTALTLMLVPAVAFAGAGGYTPGQSPVKLEKIAGSELSSVTLTAKAAERTGVETVLVREGTVTRKWLLGGVILAVPIAVQCHGHRVPVNVCCSSASRRSSGCGWRRSPAAW